MRIMCLFGFVLLQSVFLIDLGKADDQSVWHRIAINDSEHSNSLPQRLIIPRFNRDQWSNQWSGGNTFVYKPLAKVPDQPAQRLESDFHSRQDGNVICSLPPNNVSQIMVCGAYPTFGTGSHPIVGIYQRFKRHFSKTP